MGINGYENLKHHGQIVMEIEQNYEIITIPT